MKNWEWLCGISMFGEVGMHFARPYGLESVCSGAVLVASVIVVLKYWHIMCVSV